MKIASEREKYFSIREFEEGWGMEEVVCEEQLYAYCIEVLFIPEEKIEDLTMSDEDYLEVNLKNLEYEDVSEDWYVNLFKMSK